MGAISQLADGLEGVSTSTKFKQTYRDDRVAFAHDCFVWPDGGKPTDYQDECWGVLDTGKYNRIVMYGPHRIGKTGWASISVLHFQTTRDDAKTPTTASSWRQLDKYLWPDIHRWSHRLRWDVLERKPFSVQELQVRNLKLSAMCEAFAVASNDPSKIEGAQCDSLQYLFDEAKTIPPHTWDATEGAAAGEGLEGIELFMAALSTPGTPAGRLYDICSKKPGYEDWWVRHVTMEEAIAAGRMSAEWAERRIRQWGKDSPMCRQRVFGEFAEEESDSLISLGWIEAANDRWREWKETYDAGELEHDGIDPGAPLTIGVDPAGGKGKDATTIVPRYGNLIPYIVRDNTMDPMKTAGRVHAETEYVAGGNGREVTQLVEVNGIGAGVVSRLNELGDPCVGINVSEVTKQRSANGYWKMKNLRTAMWWSLREALDPSEGGELMLPPDELLTGDLMAQGYDLLSDGTIRLWPKDQVKELIGRSPDTGDGVALSYAQNREMVQVFL